MIDIHWLYAIVKVGVTERNDDTQRHSIVITIRRTFATEVTALSKKKTLSEMKSMQEKESIMGVREK